MQQVRQNKHGLVLTRSFEGETEGYLISLLCDTENTSASILYRGLVTPIFEAAKIYNAETAGEILSLPLTTLNKNLYPKCETIEDAISFVSEQMGENIVLDNYEKMIATIGKDFFKVITYTSPDFKTSTMITFGGKGMSKESIYQTDVLTRGCARKVVQQASETNPLTAKRYFLTPSIIDYIGKSYIERYRRSEFISIRNPITGKTENVSSSSERAIKELVDRDIQRYIQENVLECQKYYYADSDRIMSTFRFDTIEAYLNSVGIFIVGDFIRHSIK